MLRLCLWHSLLRFCKTFFVSLSSERKSLWLMKESFRKKKPQIIDEIFSNHNAHTRTPAKIFANRLMPSQRRAIHIYIYLLMCVLFISKLPKMTYYNNNIHIVALFPFALSLSLAANPPKCTEIESRCNAIYHRGDDLKDVKIYMFAAFMGGNLWLVLAMFWWDLHDQVLLLLLLLFTLTCFDMWVYECHKLSPCTHTHT